MVMSGLCLWWMMPETQRIRSGSSTGKTVFFSLSASIQAPTKSSDSGSVKKGDSLIVYGAYGDDGVLYADRIYVYQFES